MEKRVVLAFMLCMMFMLLYSSFLQRQMPEQPFQPIIEATPVNESAYIDLPDAYPLVVEQLEDEPLIVIYSESIMVEIGKETGSIRSVVLMDFNESGGVTPIRFGNRLPVFTIESRGSETSTTTLISKTDQSATFSVAHNGSYDYHIRYAMSEDNYLIDIELWTSGGIETPSNAVTAVLTAAWERSSEGGGYYNTLEAIALTTDVIGGKTKHKKYKGPVKKVIDVPRGTQTMTLTEQYFCHVILMRDELATVRMLPSPDHTVVAQLALTPGGPGRDQSVRAQLYVGPRDFFYLREAGIEQALPIGVIGQIGLMMLMLLSGIAKLTHNYGVAIILFSICITGALAPFTLMGMRSMKKMQLLKPEADALTAKYKQDPQRGQKEVFALYKKHRVNPISSCLPMLLQMPILFAFIHAISHYIELRGASFLWIADLSMPDRLAQLPFELPFLGSYVNALPIIMAATMFLQTKMNQSSMPSAQNNPMAKMMSGPMMSIMFAFLFYNLPAGLVLYWTINSLTSLVLYRMAK